MNFDNKDKINNSSNKSVIFHKELTDKIIASAIEVHRHLGPGLLESTYEECLCYELNLLGIRFERQKPIPLEYKGIKLDCEYRMDIVVENKAILELKCVDKILPVHKAQLITYLKLSKIKVGLIINFYEVQIRNGIRRLVNREVNYYPVFAVRIQV